MIRVRRSSRLSGLTLVVLLAGSVGLTAPAAVPAVQPSETGVGQATAQEAGAYAAGTDVALPAAPDASTDLTEALEALAGKDPTPDRAMMREAFVAAGFPADTVEVSLDITPTGLAVDSIRGAAPRDGTCLFGEVREGQVSVTALPVLDSGSCFVGDQR